jgi:SAM-dependent methyltransferase
MQQAEYQKMFELEDKHFYFVAKRFFIKTILEPYRNQIKNILDIGCGTGGQTETLTDFGKVLAIEPNLLARKLAQSRGLKVIGGKAESLPIFSNKYDLVTFLDVLYHRNIRNPEKAVMQAKRALKKNGFLLITDSAFSWLTSSHDQAMYGSRRFTIGQLKDLLVKQHFVILKISYLYFSLFPLIIIKRLLLKNKSSDVEPMPAIINYLLIGILWLESILLKWIKFPWGSSVIILAKKL